MTSAAQGPNDPNNPYATPDFDEWGWDDYWNSNEWLTWHTAMLNEFGQPEANDRFVNTWLSQSMREGATLISPLLADPDERIDWLLDNDFTDYLKNYRTSSGQNMYDAITNGNKIIDTGNWLDDAVENVAEGITGATESVSNTTKTLKWFLPVLVVLAGLLILFIIYRKSNLKLV